MRQKLRTREGDKLNESEKWGKEGNTRRRYIVMRREADNTIHDCIFIFIISVIYSEVYTCPTY